MAMKIITTNIFPPIPVRSFDFCAYYEGQEETGHYGYGASEAEAIIDLTMNYEEPGEE